MTISERPKSVQLGAHKFKILYEEKDWLKYSDEGTNKEQADGTLLAAQDVILINSGLTLTNQKKTLLHELIHLACWYARFEFIPGNLPKLRHEVEEYMVSMIENPLYDILSTNPNVRDWIFS